LQAARAMGAILARNGIRLVYGGGKTGLMGALADGALECGGEVVGIIIPGMNIDALAHRGISRMVVASTIHERKARMHQLAEGYVALPGGLGTLDELFETLTWAQIGEHYRPVGLLNVNGYFDQLLLMLDRAEKEHFVFSEHRQALLTGENPEALLEAMAVYQPPLDAVRRWMRQA